MSRRVVLNVERFVKIENSTLQIGGSSQENESDTEGNFNAYSY